MDRKTKDGVADGAADSKTNNAADSLAGFVRLTILGIILAVTLVIQFLHIHGNIQVPSVHAICPIGGLEDLWAWIAGSSLPMLTRGTMTLFFFTLIFAFVFGRAFCGNICPFGALQEFIGKICRVKISVPAKADKILRYLKYAVLVFITIMAWITSSLWITPYDPYAALAHIWAGSAMFSQMGAGFVILIVVLAASLFIERFFCKYLCPAGALYGLVSKVSPTKIKRSVCSSCGKCSKICPVNIDVAKTGTVKSAECISCSQCVIACPSSNENNTKMLNITMFGNAVKPLYFIITTVILFFGSILLFQAAGVMPLTGPGNAMESEMGNMGDMDSMDMGGMMSIEAGAKSLGMGISDFYTYMKIPQSVPGDTLLRNVSSYVSGWDLHTVMENR